MSDAPVGWAELLVAPLGPEPAPETSLAALLCLAPPLEGPVGGRAARPLGPEP
jgi:hypothetical protein